VAIKLAVMVIHGIGVDTQPGFADAMIAELKGRIDSAKKSSAEVAFSSIYWADITQPAQSAYLRAARQSADLDFMSVRQFVIGALGDAAAYQYVQGRKDSTQETIHDRIRASIRALYETQLNRKAVPLIFMAHSLGGHIISNYIWDLQHRNVPKVGLSPFEKCWTLAGMITFGCNIPLFTFAHRKVVPIKFPGRRLSKAQKAQAQWLNYYDPDDVLGYPLKPLSAAYDKVVNADITVNVGGLLSSWNPASHSHYWTDNSFTKPVAKVLAGWL